MAKGNTQVTLGRILKPVRDTLFLLIGRREFEIEAKTSVDVRVASGRTVKLPAGARWTCTVKSRDFIVVSLVETEGVPSVAHGLRVACNLSSCLSADDYDYDAIAREMAIDADLLSEHLERHI